MPAPLGKQNIFCFPWYTKKQQLVQSKQIKRNILANQTRYSKSSRYLWAQRKID